MKNFVKLIEQVHALRYMKVLTEVVTNKIPVAFLSIESTAKAVADTKKLRSQGLNVKQLITRFEPRNEDDFDVIALDEATKIHPQPEYIFTDGILAPRVALKNFPASKVIGLDGNTNSAYEIFMTHLSDLREVYESLIDEASRKTFCGYWLGRISNRLGEIVYSNAAHYLIDGFIPERGAIVIEAGVLDGGTATVFAEMGYKVYGFEMDKISYARSLPVAEENNFVVENFALGSYKRKAHYDATGQNSSKLIDGGAETVKVITLDSYVRKKNLPRVDFIKLDVEGAELDILKGAVTTIARFKPILALSAYHKFDDFWTLMNFVKSVRPDYEFAMRQSYESPEEEPSCLKDEHFFKGVDIDLLFALGLEPDTRNYNECVLFAR